MSELPPPPPPQDGGAQPGPSGGPQRTIAGFEWDPEKAKEWAERWFRPLTHSDGWLALAYLGGSAFASSFVLIAMLAFGAIVFGLMWLVVGFLLVPAFFAAVVGMNGLERTLARIAGHEIEPRPLVPIRGVGPRAIGRALTDPARWRHVAFVLVNTVVSWLFLSIGALPLWFVLQVLFGAADWSGPWGWFGGLQLLALPIAAVVAGLIPRLALWTAGLKAQFDGWFLGADELKAAQQRVSDLSAQRSDILDAVAAERRRIERNLHDGVQQQLVAIGLDLGMAARHVEDDPARTRELIDSAREKVQGSIGELRQLGRGLHPAILEDRGLDAALSAVVSGAPIPISVHVDPDLDLSTDVAETLYFVANEAVANVLKHSKARVASVHVVKVATNVRLTVHDDGIGGASPAGGTGLAGIRARINALDGAMSLTSAPGGPTTLVVEVPRHD